MLQTSVSNMNNTSSQTSANLRMMDSQSVFDLSLWNYFLCGD